MSKRVLRYATLFLLLATLLEGCAIINTMVSLKYETDYPGSASNCVSGVTGDDLCASLERHKAVAAGCLGGFLVLCVVAIVTERDA